MRAAPAPGKTREPVQDRIRGCAQIENQGRRAQVVNDHADCGPSFTPGIGTLLAVDAVGGHNPSQAQSTQRLSAVEGMAVTGTLGGQSREQHFLA